jgi:flagellar biosynthesis protein FliQ
MDLDELKNVWTQFDRNINETKQLNNQIIQRMIRERSHGELSTILNYEYLSIGITSICAMVLLFLYNQIDKEMKFMLPYLLSLLLMLGLTIYSAIKIRSLSLIDISRNNLIKTSLAVNRFKLTIQMEKLAFIVLGPLLIICMVIVLKKVMFDVDVYALQSVFIPRLLIASLVFIIASFWLYNQLYTKKIRMINDNIRELKEFEGS